MKIKSFECQYEKIILRTSDACSTSRLSHQPSKPAYYIIDCRILGSDTILTITVTDPIYTVGYCFNCHSLHGKLYMGHVSRNV